MFSLNEIKKSFLIALWFMFLTFPIMVIKVNTIYKTIEWRWERIFMVGFDRKVFGSDTDFTFPAGANHQALAIPGDGTGDLGVEQVGVLGGAVVAPNGDITHGRDRNPSFVSQLGIRSILVESTASGENSRQLRRFSIAV